MKVKGNGAVITLG